MNATARASAGALVGPNLIHVSALLHCWDVDSNDWPELRGRPIRTRSNKKRAQSPISSDLLNFPGRLGLRRSGVGHQIGSRKLGLCAFRDPVDPDGGGLVGRRQPDQRDHPPARQKFRCPRSGRSWRFRVIFSTNLASRPPLCGCALACEIFTSRCPSTTQPPPVRTFSEPQNQDRPSLAERL